MNKLFELILHKRRFVNDQNTLEKMLNIISPCRLFQKIVLWKFKLKPKGIPPQT